MCGKYILVRAERRSVLTAGVCQLPRGSAFPSIRNVQNVESQEAIAFREMFTWSRQSTERKIGVFLSLSSNIIRNISVTFY